MPFQPDNGDIEYPIAPSEWPYLSKSRLTAYVKNPRHAYYVYVAGMREPETFYMVRGSRIHKALEIYYENIVAVWKAEGGVYDDLTKYLPRDALLWADFTDPFISNFLLWENRRLDAVESLEDFIPVAIEAEVWLEEPPVENSPPWMGFADVVLNAASVPEVETDEGVVVVDFKTGKTPDEKYRDKGIFLEGEYYAMLFEDAYDVAAVAGYYPKNDDFVVSELSADRRDFIIESIAEMMTLGTDMEEWDTNPNPLCKWGPGDDQESPFYRVCDCPWGKAGGPGPTFD